VRPCGELKGRKDKRTSPRARFSRAAPAGGKGKGLKFPPEPPSLISGGDVGKFPLVSQKSIFVFTPIEGKNHDSAAANRR